jgi:hypothetical protein
MKGITRRGFVRIAGSVVAGVAGGTVRLLEPKMLWAAQSPTPSDTVRFGIIGAGTQGCDLLRHALKVPGAECVAVSDLYDTRLETAKTISKKNVDAAKDYRHILDRKEIDAVIVATPDHWHRRLFWVDAPQSPPLSDTRLRFRDGFRSPAGCAAATSPAVPELRLVVSSLRSRHWTYPRSLQASAGINVPDATLVGRFSGDNQWPVLGDR